MKHTKKLFAILLLFIMLLSFVGCDFSLAEEKSSFKITAADANETASYTISANNSSMAASHLSDSEMVWIPRTGCKYHKNESCSNMKYPTQVTRQEAVSLGYEQCKKCYFIK